MGRNKVRWVYTVDMEQQRYRLVRVYNGAGVNFNVLVQAQTDEEAMQVASEREPGYQYEPLDVHFHRLFLNKQYVTK